MRHGALLDPGHVAAHAVRAGRMFGERRRTCQPLSKQRRRVAAEARLIAFLRRRRLVRVVAGGALEGLRRGTRRDEALALPQTIRMRDDVDGAGDLEECVLVAQRLRRHVAEVGLPVAQHRDRGMYVALLAHVHAPLERQAGRVHDGAVVRAGMARRSARRDVQRARTVASLAADAGPHFRILPFQRWQGARIAGVAGEAPIGHQPVEAGVVDLVAWAEVPAVRSIPGERQLEEPAVLLGEIGAGHLAASHDVVHAPTELVQLLAIGRGQTLHLIELPPILHHRIGEPRRRVPDRGSERRLDARGRRPAVERLSHGVLAVGRCLTSMARHACRIANVRGGRRDVMKTGGRRFGNGSGERHGHIVPYGRRLRIRRAITRGQHRHYQQEQRRTPGWWPCGLPSSGHRWRLHAPTVAGVSHGRQGIAEALLTSS